MEDIEVIKQLMRGNHLSNKELDQAEILIYRLTIEHKGRARE